ncbi:hypothetical protein EIN_428170 [Entamoeba invadens IP1]|uniref:Uncharacterized protein n=1 Tax=Entamoeba invadens IP1 TaxID=370355 RepID=A0A0A1UEW4_ENTIV|nr:hypothetical protein EIN_428170 [Entamoeba invadens IP1]ELP95141.1 hypothetical protein EIN_428170 [Entamoeba invadens IP1]|eukprot:XP_004261912.1 hypothetical protein EIN_428170 [Entamoeba invadens IP1]
MEIEQEIACLYNRNVIPLEVGESPMRVLLKFYEQCCPHPIDEEKDFITTDHVTLRNTAINSLIGRGEITDEKIQEAMKSHIEKQRDFHINWKYRQAMRFLSMY